MENSNGVNTSGLLDDEKSIVVPLMVVGIFLVMVLLAFGLFMPNTNWEF
jgi:hypothetical protein